MQARRAAGLPGLSINWGAWAEVGMAAGVDERTKTQWLASGIELISPAEGVALLGQLLPQAAAQVGVLPLNWAKLGQASGGVVERPFLRDLLTSREPAPAAAKDAIRQELADAPAGDRLGLLQTYVQVQVMRVLGLGAAQTPDVRQGLTDIGMDSLMAVELSNRLQAGLQQPLPTTLAFEYPTIAALTHFLADEVLHLAPEEEETAVAPALKAESSELLAELEDLSESELTDSLLKELEEAGY